MSPEESEPTKKGRSTSYNRVVVVGRLGADAESTALPSGTPKLSLRLATNEYWIDKDGSPKERTDWHNVIAWGKLAEAYGQYLTKGRLVLVEGSLQYREYEKDGVKHKTTEIVARGFEFMDSPRTNNG